jgi:hypothetical protein
MVNKVLITRYKLIENARELSTFWHKPLNYRDMSHLAGLWLMYVFSLLEFIIVC